MHIPDGFLSAPVYLATGAASGLAVGVMVRRAQQETEDSRAPMLGVMGAFVFAAQMINFPVAAGTTGHLLGGALLAFTVGPASAVVVMTAVLAIQALIFQDGGVLALGANILNMAVAGVLAGYLPYRFLDGRAGRGAAIFLGGLLSVMTCALLALAELLLSGIIMPRAVLTVSLGLFAVNAVIEGAITLGVVRGLESLDAGWIKKPSELRRPAMAALALAAVWLAAVGVVFAAGAPDGLEKLAENIGIASRSTTLFSTPLADYRTRFIADPWLSKAAAGVAGLALVYAAALLIARLRSEKRGN